MNVYRTIGIVLLTLAAVAVTGCKKDKPPAPKKQQTPAAKGRTLKLAWTSKEENGTYCVAWGDVDGDGDPDLAVGNKWGPGKNQLYRNDGGKLVLAWTADKEDATESDGLAWGDVDGDGDLDLAVGNDSEQPNKLYVNEKGKLTLAWRSAETDRTRGVAWADVDGDGDLDLAVANVEGPNRLYRNDAGKLKLVWTSAESDRSEGLAWGDYDGDGDPDLAVANYRNQQNRLYRNDGGKLVLAWSTPEHDQSLGVAWADVDGDGDQDLAVASEGDPTRIYENTGGGLKLAWSSEETDNSRTVAWGDWDNDGDLDLAVANEGQQNQVYRNDGGKLVLAWTCGLYESTVSAAWADVNGDGFLDLVFGNKGANRLYLNVAGAPTVHKEQPLAIEREPLKPAPKIGKWGFRYDPMQWIEKSRSIQAAKIRTFVLERPQTQDAKLLQDKIDTILARQKPDGGFGEDGAWKPVVELMQCGADGNRPKVRKAVDWIVANNKAKDGMLGIYRLRGVCAAGGEKHAKLRDASIDRLAKEMQAGVHGNCPWSPSEHLRTLGATQRYMTPEAADAALSHDLKWMAENINEAGFLSYKDPWGFINAAAAVDHPLARDITIKMIPMILRQQQPDGGWGHGSYAIFKLLHQYGLLEPLCNLPPLPAEWKIVRSIPAPGKGLWSMTFGRGRLWVLRPGAGEVIAVSPADGKVLQTLKLPVAGAVGVSWWDGKLAVTKGKPNEVVQIDPATGKVTRRVATGDIPEETSGITQVGKTLWLADGWQWIVHAVDPDKPKEARHILLGAPAARTDLAFAGDGVWHYAWHALVKTDIKAPTVRWLDETAGLSRNNGPVLDWAEVPIGCRVAGLAWDGNALWLLDSARNRICLIEKSGATKWEPPPRPVGFIRQWLMCGPFPSPALPEKELAAIVAKRKDESNVELIRAGHRIDYLKPIGGEAAAKPTDGQAVKRPDGSIVKWRKYESPAEAIWLHEVFGEVGRGPMVAYAYTTIRRAKGGKAFLALGNDDSVKVYLNGRLVRDAHVAGPLEIYQDFVPVTFKKGDNMLLIKVENTFGTGGFILRPLDSLPARGPALFPGRRGTWSGFDLYDFKVDGRNCTVVTPSKAAPGKPWIWRARFFGHEPQTDIALLNNGFHLVYMDVADMWGSDKAVAHWDAFYKFLTEEHGLSKKAALEGMSRGGLIIYNWGARNPDKVTCIYGDAPLCNFKMTRPAKEGEPGVDNEYLIEQILRPLAKAGVPLIHVCGDADKSVSLEGHTRVLEKRYKELGGRIKVIVKPGVGHHPHSLKDPTPIVNFILKATSREAVETD